MKNIRTTLTLIILLNSIISYAQTGLLTSNKCLTFDGKTSEVSFKNNDLGLSGGNTLTVTAWVKWNSFTSMNPWANVVTLNNSTGNGDIGQFWFQHNQNNTKFEFAVQTLTTRNIIQSTINPVTGTWYHIAGVYDGSFVTLYVNGIAQGKNILTGNINNFQGNFKLNIGKWANSTNNYRRFNGDIDEVTIWKKALTQTEIKNMMCRNLKGNETGLVGYWAMNETSGSNVNDPTSNGRTGTNLSAYIVESGAPIGSVSAYTYGGTRLSITHPIYGDSLVIDNFSAPIQGVHIYRMDSVLNVTAAPIGFKRIIPYYFGVFIVNSSGQTYQTT